MSQCKCTMAQSVTGDGCRYCQPQEYIDRLHEYLETEREEVQSLADEITAYEERIAQLEQLLRSAAYEINESGWGAVELLAQIDKALEQNNDQR